MGIKVTDINRNRHRQQATGLLEWTVRLHFGDGQVDTVSPPIGQLAETGLRSVAQSMATFGPVAAATWGAWWPSLTSLPVPSGSAGWQELVRLDYAAPL